MTRRTSLLTLTLSLAVFISAMEVVLHRHQTRELFLVLQELRAQQNELDREWGQLLLEQGTWATHSRIEDIAREKLKMTPPDTETVFRVRS